MGLSTKQILIYKGAEQSGLKYSNTTGFETFTPDELFLRLTEKTSERNTKLARITVLDGAIPTQETIYNNAIKLANERGVKYQNCVDARASKSTGAGKNKACHIDELGRLTKNWQFGIDERNAALNKLNLWKEERTRLEGEVAVLEGEVKQLNTLYSQKSGKPPVNTSTGNASLDSRIEKEVAKAGGVFKSSNKKIFFVVGGIAVVGLVGVLMFRKR